MRLANDLKSFYDDADKGGSLHGKSDTIFPLAKCINTIFNACSPVCSPFWKSSFYLGGFAAGIEAPKFWLPRRRLARALQEAISAQEEKERAHDPPQSKYPCFRNQAKVSLRVSSRDRGWYPSSLSALAQEILGEAVRRVYRESRV